MKTQNVIKNLFFLSAMGLVLGTTSCKKDKVTEEVQQNADQQYLSSADNATTEDLSSDLDELAQDEADKSMGSGKLSGDEDGCRIVERDSLGPDLRQVTITFKDSCVGKDGRERKGKIIILIQGKPWLAGSSLTITPEDYYVDGFHLEGVKEVLYQGQNSAGNYLFTVKVKEGKITSPEGIFVTFEFEKNKEFVIGDPTNPADDVLLISGYAEGTNRDGKKYEAKTLEPLKRIRGCHFIVAGILEVKAEDHDAATIDFGDGTCDDEAVVKIGGKSKVIKLKKPWKR